MTLRTAPRLLLAAAAFVAAAAPTAAQGFGVSFQRHGRHSDVSIGFETGRDHDRRHGRGDRYDHDRRGHDRRGHQVWIPGRYETVAQQVWVPGRTRQVWCDAVYDTCYDACGRPYRRCVSQGYWKTIQEPGCYETRYVQVWREGYWASR
jgi:hypothetical protein